MQSPVTKIEPIIAAKLQKQSYHLVGEHGGVKVCHWTKENLKNDRDCYKGTFYGIQSSGCMQMAPNVDTCNLACTYCWREPHSETLNKVDTDPEMLFYESVRAHRRLLTGFKGHPSVTLEKWQDATDRKIKKGFKKSAKIQDKALTYLEEKLAPRITKIKDKLTTN